MTGRGAASLFNPCEFPRPDHEPLVVEFYAGDILSRYSDALLVSSFRGSYHPTSGSILGALYEQNGIAFGPERPPGTVSVHPRLHLFPVPPCASFHHLWILEVKEITDPAPPTVADVSVAFSVLKGGIRKIATRGASSISMPLIGTGDVGFNVHEVAWKTLELICNWAATTPTLRCVRVFTWNVEKFATLNLIIDKFFGSHAEPATSLLLQAAHEELAAATKMLSVPGITSSLKDLVELTSANPASAKSIALVARTLAENCAKMLAPGPEGETHTLGQLLSAVVQPLVEETNQR